MAPLRYEPVAGTDEPARALLAPLQAGPLNSAGGQGDVDPEQAYSIPQLPRDTAGWTLFGLGFCCWPMWVVALVLPRGPTGERPAAKASGIALAITFVLTVAAYIFIFALGQKDKP